MPNGRGGYYNTFYHPPKIQNKNPSSFPQRRESTASQTFLSHPILTALGGQCHRNDDEGWLNNIAHGSPLHQGGTPCRGGCFNAFHTITLPTLGTSPKKSCQPAGFLIVIITISNYIKRSTCILNTFDTNITPINCITGFISRRPNTCYRWTKR